MATTVQQFIAKAVALIDDTENLTDYNTGYFPMVSNVISEMMIENIGTKDTVYTIPDFTTLTQTIPLTDNAINGVAVFGLAALLSLSNNTSLTNYFEQKYADAKRTWKKNKKAVVSDIEDVYQF